MKPPNISLQPTAPSLASLARSQRLSSVPLGNFVQNIKTYEQ